MSDPAKQILRSRLDDGQLDLFAFRLLSWLTGHQSLEEENREAYSESRAKAILRTTNSIDMPQLRQFLKQMSAGGDGAKSAYRVALYDLLTESGLADHEDVIALAAGLNLPTTSASAQFDSWLSLALASYAWRNEYPLDQLDPSSPPDPFSPAGQLIKQAASFIRRQVQRTATERDRLGKTLRYQAGAVPGLSPLGELEPGAPIAPIPPYFRPPVPVTYPEVASETLTVETNEGGPEMPAARQPEIAIADGETPSPETVQRMPPIRITADQVPGSRRAPSRVVTPSPATPPPSSFGQAVRNRFSRGREAFGSTKLRVVVQDHQDGTGLHGLQVRVTCAGVRSHVAGTTNRDGTFVCELPVRMRSGLTYDVEVTWPRDLGGEIERKSITLNADRTTFLLPFYHRYQ